MRQLPIPEVIDGYVPRGISANVWSEIEDEVRAIVRDSNPGTSTTADHHMLGVARFLAWAHGQGRSRDPEALFTPDTVEFYIATACDHLSPESRGTRRSVLRTVGRRITRRAPWEPPTPKYPTSVPHPPYSQDQCRWLVECVAEQSTPRRTRVLQCGLGLGLGAGLAPSEIAWLTTSCITDSSHGCLAIVLPDRVVPVRNTYAPLLRALRDDLRPGSFLLRDRKVQRVEDMSNMIASCVVPGELRPLTVTRMRLTWAFHALCAPIPLPAVMAAYGARTLKFTDRLLPYLVAQQSSSLEMLGLHEF